MQNSIFKSYDDLPLFLNAAMVAKALGVSISSAYELFSLDLGRGRFLLPTTAGAADHRCLPTETTAHPITQTARIFLCVSLCAVFPGWEIPILRADWNR